MNSINRLAYKELLIWKNQATRKPLLLRGARQVGKTTLVNEFAKEFKHYIALNLERESDAAYFKKGDSVKVILEQILFSRGISVNDPKELLLFIDEIQEVPEAIALLRYFYEDLPEWHVVAAGSLLEFALGDVKKMPVGRLEFLHVFPLNFAEYLGALNKPLWLESIQTIPISSTAHHVLLNQFHKYCIIGGMPEVVKNYIQADSITRLPKIYSSIWETYKADVEKYANNETEGKVIRHILNTAYLYLDERIKFQNFGNSNYRSREVSEAFTSIGAAGLLRLIYPSSSMQAPILPDFKKSPRMLFLDVGLVNHLYKIQADLLGLDDLSEAYKGALIPQMVYQEILSRNSNSLNVPNFWVREKSQSSAEIDLILEHKNLIIPVEIKSGPTGSLKSLHQFVNRSNHSYAIRMFAGSFSIQQQTTPEGKPYTLMNLPYYLGYWLPEYIEYFVSHYPKNPVKN